MAISSFNFCVAQNNTYNTNINQAKDFSIHNSKVEINNVENYNENTKEALSVTFLDSLTNAIADSIAKYELSKTTIMVGSVQGQTNPNYYTQICNYLHQRGYKIVPVTEFPSYYTNDFIMMRNQGVFTYITIRDR